MFFSRKSKPETLDFILLEGGSAAVAPLAIRMIPSAQYGGALLSVGPAIPIPWSAVLEKGISAFDRIRTVSPQSEGNRDLAPRTGRLRKRKTVLVEVRSDEVILSPERKKAGRREGARDEDRIYLKLPISGEALEQALREAFVRAR